ncbi:MAG: ribosome biogenesis GTPase Der [Clostridia bacterium]|nr:ribosome biogenesis GTPase Der [Clostridia bacterium]
MKKPLVAVVGRPNVGKSTLFNRICGRRISIVKDVPGVTRDRIYGDAEWCGYAFSLVDTGGIDKTDTSGFQENIVAQAQIAVELADVVLLVVDGKQGLVPADYEAVEFLRRFNVPVILVVNKIDNNELENTYEFYNLGLGEPMPVSAEHNKGVADVLDVVISKFQSKIDPEKDSEKIKVAVVGKPNAGKSSLVNKLIGQNRVMVSDIAGTTRDAIDTPFTYNDTEYLLIDTAGIRRKRGIESESVELYSVIRAFEAIRRADVVILVVDAKEGLSEQDVRIAGFIHEEGKPSVVLMNKWDLIEKDDKTMNKFNEKLAEDLKFMDYYIPEYVSVLTGQRMNKVMESVELAYSNSMTRVPTSTLNDILQKAVLSQEPPSHKGKRLKINYITQADVAPPTFVLFVNDKDLLHFSYERFLTNALRSAIDFRGTPIKLVIKNKSEKD